MNCMSNCINLFVLETELQYLAFSSIKKKVEQDSVIVFTTSSRIHERLLVDGEPCFYVSRESHGWLGRLLRIRKNLLFYKKQVLHLGRSFDKIVLNVPRIDNIHNNIAINYFKHHFPMVTVVVRLIPDGAINIFSSTLSNKKIRTQEKWKHNVGFKIFKDLQYYDYQGDELGADAGVVDKIYCFRGVDTGYLTDKLEEIDLPIQTQYQTDKEQKSALVIGQNFLQLGSAPEDFVTRVCDSIAGLIKSLNIKQVTYAPHPRSTYDEFKCDYYSEINGQYICIEECIAKGHYTHIISCYSSALLNSKIMFKNKIQVYSVGLDEFPFPVDGQADLLVSAYRSMGINIVEMCPTNRPNM